MSWAQIAHASKAASGANGPVTTTAADTTGADFIADVTAIYSGGTGVSVSDSKSNTWTARTSYTGNADVIIRIYYCQNPAVGSGHTFSLNGTSIYGAIAVMAFSGSTATPYDTENGTGYASATSGSSGSITPAQTNELLVLGAGFGTGNTASAPTADNSFSAAIDYVQGSSGVSYGVASFWLADGNTSAINPTVSWSGAANAAIAIAAFKAAGGATRPVKMVGRWGGYAGSSGGFAG